MKEGQIKRTIREEKVSFVKRHHERKYERKKRVKISLLIGSVLENCDLTSKFLINKTIESFVNYTITLFQLQI